MMEQGYIWLSFGQGGPLERAKELRQDMGTKNRSPKIEIGTQFLRKMSTQLTEYREVRLVQIWRLHPYIVLLLSPLNKI